MVLELEALRHEDGLRALWLEKHHRVPANVSHLDR
jgi:hypothetical protein